MPKRLSQMQVDSYHRDGFVSPVAVMGNDEAALLRHRLELAERRYPQAVNAESQSALLAYLPSHLGPTENQKMEALV